MAYRIIRPADHDTWLREREKGIGSSEATALMGVNHYEDIYKLFMRKTHRLAPKEETEQMALGHHLEPAVASRFAELTGAWIAPESVGDWIAADQTRDYLRVSPDRLWVPKGEEQVKENWRILECKTTALSVDPDNLPPYWYCQLQYQMGVMGIRHGALAWISSFPVFNFGYREVDFNEDYYNLIVTAIDEFWNNNILKDTAPDPVDVADLRELYSRDKAFIKGKSFVGDDWMQDSYNELVDIKMQMDTLKDRKEELEEELEKAIMGYEVILAKDGETPLATRLPKKCRSTMDVERFRQEYPDIYADYLVVQEGEFDQARFKKDCKDLYKQYVYTPQSEEIAFKIEYPKKKAERKVETVF